MVSGAQTRSPALGSTPVAALAAASSLDGYRAAVDILGRCHEFFTKNHAVLNHLPEWIRQPEKGGMDVEAMERVLARARDDIREFEEHLRRSHPPDLSADDADRERDILTCCALRFDGYKYIEVSGFDANDAVEVALRGGPLPANPLERFAVFFLLQRYLFKWGGERQPADGRHWRLFRELFLSVADQRVPVEFRPSDDHHRLRWRHHYRLRLRETIGFVRDIHERTGYRDARV